MRHRCRHGGDAISQSGVALVVVMWLVAALSLLVSGLVATTRADLRGTQVLKQFAVHAALGDGAIRLAASQLKVTPLADRSPAVGLSLDDYELVVEVLPASAFVNLNSASIELLRDTLQFGADLPEAQAQMLAERIADWRDLDEDPLPGGAERLAYEAAGSRFRPRNGPFESVDDLIQVLGVNLEVHDKLRGLFTTHGVTPGVDPRFAPPAVLRVLAAGNAGVVERMLSARRAQDPVFDMTGLTQQHLAQTSSGPYRILASHRTERTLLVRARWIDLSSPRPDLPWTELSAEPVESFEIDTEVERGL